MMTKHRCVHPLHLKNCNNEFKATLLRLIALVCTAVLWCNFKGRTFDKGKVAYNNIFRAPMGYSRRISVYKAMIDLSIDPFIVVYRTFIVSFSKRILSCENNHQINSHISPLGKCGVFAG